MKVTKWSIFNGELTVSDHEAEQISGETGSVNAHSGEKPSEPVAASPADASTAQDAEPVVSKPEPVVSEPMPPEPSERAFQSPNCAIPTCSPKSYWGQRNWS